MISKLHFYIKIFFLLVSRRLILVGIIKEDYNSLASTYDEYFSNFTKLHSQELVRRLNINDTATVLDLACGTGTITVELRKYMSEKGRILAVDSSDHMLKKAKEKINGKNAEFICGDMLEILDKFQENYFDYVTCGWAIGYVSDVPPKKESSYNVSLEGQKGVTNGQEELDSGTDHQQAEGSREPHQPGYPYR